MSKIALWEILVNALVALAGTGTIDAGIGTGLGLALVLAGVLRMAVWAGGASRRLLTQGKRRLAAAVRELERDRMDELVISLVEVTAAVALLAVALALTLAAALLALH
ncbi:hypothetical protein Lfu02_67880 [Longispora fulva]|uniref:DUF3899 domain-containing protein n=1 Tax=Longispora fulva TaxID=619741 RepID=A0A8J7GUP0_9ACTN|nr:hypothetical protein [Longispora fulva]MBG6138478.1 hypothetical protein [Longispora fulva]GIG62416.1 hypothetical protein Lfu02_67880 [Longispora fulva]